MVDTLNIANDTSSNESEVLIPYKLETMATNTFFQIPKNKLYTWKLPAYKKEKVVRSKKGYNIVSIRDTVIPSNRPKHMQ